MTGRRDKLIAILLSLVLLAGAVAIWRTGLLDDLYAHREVIAKLRQAGYWGPLLCIGVQFIQVVIFFIPGEITQFAAGYVFGTGPGFLYSFVGIMLGSAFNFYFARLVGRPAVERFIRREQLDKMDRAIRSAKGRTAVFLLFLVPGMPKDAMSYAAGLSSLGLGEFVMLSGLARTPALLVSILLGAQASREDYRGMGITAVLATAAFLAYYLYHRWRRAAAAGTERHPQ